jgi:ATP-binding cassette, subfamily F, member 3
MDQKKKVILRFDDVTFEYIEKKPLMKGANFSVRENTKLTLMGQNGAGKSTLFKLITGEFKPQRGLIHINEGIKIGVAAQVMERKFFPMTVGEYFATAFDEAPRNLPVLIDEALDAVNYKIPHDQVVQSLSGGQQARLLLAYALIQKPDILLLDEPTNNLDAEGIGHLMAFLMMYEKTVIVISHDADFLSTFTDGVIYLDFYTKEIDQYVGDYYDVVEQIKKRIDSEERKNAQLKKSIQDRKDKVNFFAHKGGKMRKLAKKLKDEVAEDEDAMVRVKTDDKTIAAFTIDAENFKESHATLSSVGIWVNGEVIHKPVEIELRRGGRLLVKGPNGIGKTTLLERLANKEEEGAVIPEAVKVGYYRQDFSGLDFSQTAYDSLKDVIEVDDPELIFGTAARFLLRGNTLQNPIGMLSEGQKALLTFARFVLQKPSLLILDEPTNHVNFRHLPVIAEALSKFEGAMIVVSHDEEFVRKIEFTDVVDLGRLRDK